MAPVVSAAPSAAPNDGTNVSAPTLSPDDESFTDPRRGFGWGDRCVKELRAGKLGWARAACDKALALPDLDARARPPLLFNEGLIAEKSGDLPLARNYFTQSLELREVTDPGRGTVEKELTLVGGTPPPLPPPDAMLCDVVPPPPGYEGIRARIHWKSMSGVLELSYKTRPARYFNVAVAVWPSGCPRTDPMLHSPVCHGAFMTYSLVFRGYASTDTTPPGENLVPGKTTLATVVQHPKADEFAFTDLEPAVYAAPTMECRRER